jgi:hypothetical protein
LSGQREVGGTLASFEDAKLLCDVVTGGELGECEFVKATSFWELLSPDNKRFESYDEIDISNMPEILLVPSLDTGNIICKLDVFLNIRRRSLATTTKGPILIPSRSDPCDSIVGEIAMGVVVADGIKAYNNDKNL